MKLKRLPPRAEQLIFDELASLCASPGYIHAIAYLCFRDNIIQYSGEMKAENMQHLFSKNRLIRTETSTLIGLMLKHEIDYTLPEPQTLQKYIDITEALLEEIHGAMTASAWAGFDPVNIANQESNLLASAAALRESIFYSAESAYSFQYRDFSLTKYGHDDAWLIDNKGFSIHEARNIVYTISRLQDEKITATLRLIRTLAPNAWTFLPYNVFSVKEISDHSRISSTIVEKVLAAFAVPSNVRNEQFAALHDFNIVNATPLICTPEGHYILFHIYSLVEALYESPIHWMRTDGSYKSTAIQNRGLFTEEFAVERLKKVFGVDNVLSNIDIYESKSKKLGEIDVLVVFGNRALIVQAKSKTLTLEARRGNDFQIKDDFKKSIQDSSDQAYRCAKLLEDGKCSFKDATGNSVSVPTNLKRIYVVCLISDHYPALSFQARQFLTCTPTATISHPFVMDVFTLDAMTEMLNSPLQLLSYIDRRTGYSDKLMASHELTILSYHIKQNLWLNEEHEMVMLDDDISADLDLAMLVRREGISGKETPDGMLTRFSSTALGRMLKAIESKPDPETLDLGFMLLTLGEDAVNGVSAGIEQIAQKALSDGKPHDMAVSFGHGSTGLTIHCNADSMDIAEPRLRWFCQARKYTEHAQTWFGVCIWPSDQSLRFGLNLDYVWTQSNELDVQTNAMKKPSNLAGLLKKSTAGISKIGRNDPCACGSGKKFKKCCLI
jgi:hypothetical protein